MNYFIAPMLRRGKDARPEPGRNLKDANKGLNSVVRAKAEDLDSLRDTSLPWEILEAANALFQKKGFERTSITDICRRLEIKPFEFHTHFDSLDEVLEILWAS